VLISLCYLVLRRVLQLAVWRLRSNDLKELEIVVLRHELAILRRRTELSPRTFCTLPRELSSRRLERSYRRQGVERREERPMIVSSRLRLARSSATTTASEISSKAPGPRT
jgi:hypothetical protein